MRGWMYILRCADGSYYTGSTNNLMRRLMQHEEGEGANYTKRRLPVTLVYFEEFPHVSQAFYREKQIQGWTRAKKEALMKQNPDLIHLLAQCRNSSHFKNFGLDIGTE